MERQVNFTTVDGDVFMDVMEIDSIGKRHGHRYKIVNKIPPGYLIWSIGDLIGVDNYVPLCILLGNGPEIDVNRLCAIKLPDDECKILRNAGLCGAWSLESARKMCDTVTLDEWEENRLIWNFTRGDLDKAIEIFERITTTYKKEKFDSSELSDMQMIDNGEFMTNLLGGN